MRMSAELQIDSSLRYRIYLERSMIEKYGWIFFFEVWEIFYGFGDIFPHSWLWIVYPDDIESV